MNNRWYDEHPEIGHKLEAFKDMDLQRKDVLIKGIMAIVRNYDPSLLTYEKAFDFPFSLKRHRWYDSDPYLWMLFNTLMMADERLLNSVTIYLMKELPEK